MKKILFFVFSVAIILSGMALALAAPAWLGECPPGATINFTFSTNDANGSSINPSANGTIRVYRENSTTQLADGDANDGITATMGFDNIVGVHLISIDTSLNEFYTAGRYNVVDCNMTIVGQTLSPIVATFSLVSTDPNITAIKAKTDQLLFAVSGAIRSADVNTPARASNGYWKVCDPNLPAVKTDTAAIKLQTDQLTFGSNGVSVEGTLALSTTVDANSGNSPTKVYMAKSSALDNAYKDMLVMITDLTDPNDTQVRRITGSTASTMSINLDAPLDFTPANGDLVYIQDYQPPARTGRY